MLTKTLENCEWNGCHKQIEVPQFAKRIYEDIHQRKLIKGIRDYGDFVISPFGSVYCCKNHYQIDMED